MLLPMTSVPTDNQREVDWLLRRAWFNAVVWVCGIGSYRAIGYARRAMQIIRSSSEPLTGMTRARFAYGLGVFGVAIWLPFVVIGIAVSLINR